MNAYMGRRRSLSDRKDFVFPDAPDLPLGLFWVHPASLYQGLGDRFSNPLEERMPSTLTGHFHFHGEKDRLRLAVSSLPPPAIDGFPPPGERKSRFLLNLALNRPVDEPSREEVPAVSFAGPR